MMRLVLAMVAVMAFSGCQHRGQQAIDPFWGRTTVPAPPTGAVCAPVITPGCGQPFPPQTMTTPGTPLPSGGLQAIPQPNLIPAPTSPNPAATGTGAAPATTPGVTGSPAPYGSTTPTITTPPPGSGTTGTAPPSGYSGSDSSAGSRYPATTIPGAGSTGSNPSSVLPSTPGGTSPWPSPPATSGSTSSPYGGSSSPYGGSLAPLGSGSGSLAPTGTLSTPAPASSPGSGGVPGYSPPDGSFKYPDRSESTRPGTGNTWTTPGGVAAAPVSLDGATVSSPLTSGSAGLDSSPSVVRIPAAASGNSTVPASAEIPLAPGP
jgi:hypothetical protein